MEEHYLLFEKYITETLSNEELVQFNYKISSDPKFKEDFFLYQKTSSFLEKKMQNEASLKNFKKNITTISTEYFQKEKATNKTLFKPWKYGIVASFLLILGIYIFSITDAPTYNNFVTYNKINLIVRGEQNQLLAKAEKAYNKKDFKNANIYFTELLKTDINNTQLQLHKAFSLIELHKFEEADRILSNLSNGNSAYKNKATWYLALSKLKQINNKSCIAILKTIPKDAFEYKMAKKLLLKLE